MGENYRESGADGKKKDLLLARPFIMCIIFCPTSKRTHPYQRGRASITGLGLKLRKIIETGRLIGVARCGLIGERKSQTAARDKLEIGGPCLRTLGRAPGWLLVNFPIIPDPVLRNSSPIVKEHAPLSVRASVDHGGDVETTLVHENRSADRGCCVSTCSLLRFSGLAWPSA
jgi:hypothetical protein